MSGTLTGLGLSQRVDVNGIPLSGWLLYIYEAFGTTPATSYSDTGLTILQPFPLQADSFGMMPMFWLPDGTYRARATTFDGSQTLFDVDGFLALGPSSGGGGGGGGVDTNATFLTGDPLWRPTTGARAGFVRLNGLTIGSVSSGATERSNADAQALYVFKWNTYSDALCPVSGGRGSSGLADFNANKPMATLDMRGCNAFGLDDMGNTAASRIAAATSGAVLLGVETASTPILQANLPNVGFNVSLVAASHAHGAGSYAVGTTITNGTNQAVVSGGVGTSGWTSGGSGGSVTISLANGAVGGASGASGALSVSGSVTSGGSDTALNIPTLSPGRAGTWYMRL